MVAVLVANEQSERAVDDERWASLATATLRSEGLDGEVELSIRFVDEGTIAELNELFLGHIGPTDVLSFPIEDEPRRAALARGTAPGTQAPLLLGDIVICPEVAARNAPEHAGSYEDELALLLVHGILHLLGMDHELDDEAEAMEARERQLLAEHHGFRAMTDVALFGADFAPPEAGMLAAVVVLLAGAGCLALAETGLVRTSRARARSLAEQERPGARSLVRLVEDPESFLAPVLLLVLICQLVAATLVGVVASRLFGVFGVAVATLFEVIVIFVFAEAVPKQWAIRRADRAALLTAPFVSWVIKFPPIRLISTLLTGIARLVIRVLFGEENDTLEPDVTESELLALADVAVEADVIEVEERALLTSIIEFGDTIVREVMAPRPDVIAVDEQMPVGAALEGAIASGLSRVPVYRSTVDDIVGIAYTRDLIKAVRNAGADEPADAQPVGKLAREAHYVPETKRVAPLLREMQREQFHLAVVVDEYGGTAGIVTLEDLIEELVGEIADEFDNDEPEVELIGEGELRVSGRMSVDEVNELARVDLPTGDWDTIAGLLLHLRAAPLAEGEAIETGNVRLVAERVQGRRIKTVRIVRIDPVVPIDFDAVAS